jgi:peptidyl-prolyl cis-trans isomerase C
MMTTIEPPKIRVVLVLLGVLCLSGCNPKEVTHPVQSKPYVTVNGVAQPATQAELLLRDQISRGVPDSQILRDNIRELLINQAVLVQEAEKAGLEKEPLLQAQIELARQNLLIQAWQQKQLGDINPTEEELKAEYERQLAHLGDNDYLIRHLLVKEESTAKLLIDKLKTEKMETLAQEYSLDQASMRRGGLTDWTNIADLLPPLAATISKLQKGQFATKPVQSPMGWHVVQLEDVRSFKAAPFEQFKPQLINTLRQKTLEERVKALRQKAKVE